MTHTFPKPIEVTHPKLGDMLSWWCNRDQRYRRTRFSLDVSFHVDALCKRYLRSLGYTFPDFGKVGRNETCPCGSGKKYKRCHGG